MSHQQSMSPSSAHSSSSEQSASFADLAAAAAAASPAMNGGGHSQRPQRATKATHQAAAAAMLEDEYGSDGGDSEEHANDGCCQDENKEDANGTGGALPDSANGTVTTGSSSRTARACSWCRRRKRKCDGARPTCCWCARGKLVCNYPSTLLKRGPQSGMMKKLKRKVEELEQQLNSVRVPPSLSLDGHTTQTTMSLTSFISRIRSSRAYHDAMLAVSPIHPNHVNTLQTQSSATHSPLRDRLYLTSFLCSFNEIFPILDQEWEAQYLAVLYDDGASVEPPLHWSFLYASAIALGALIHDDAQYANESAIVARHVASALFDEAHAQVLRGLLLLSFVLIGLGQSARASCYIAVANRMVYLLSRPPCIDPHVANTNHQVTSTLAFPGTFPDARVALNLPPEQHGKSGFVSEELKLVYSLVEDMSSAATTLKGMVTVGWDQVEACVLEKRRAAKGGVKTEPAPSNPPTSIAAIMNSSNLDPTVSLVPFSKDRASHQPYYDLSNDHLLTLGLECRHYSPDVFTEHFKSVESWQAKNPDMTIPHRSILKMFVFLTSFRGDFMQMVPPAKDAQAHAGATEGKPALKSTALSQRHFEISLANTRAALKVAEALCDVLAKPGHDHTGSSAQTLEAMIRQATSTQAKTPVKVEGQTNGAASPQSMSLKTLLTKVDPSNPIAASVLLPLHKQSTRHQLHALALCFKSIFMHMLVLEQDCNLNTLGRTTSDGKASTEGGAKDSPVTEEVAAAAFVPSPPTVKFSWSNVILASNTATSFIDTHGLDMTYCPFFAVLFHLGIQIKLKYVKSCVASFKRSQNWQYLQATKKLAGEASGDTQMEDASKEVPPPGVVISLPTATQSLLDSLHYLHIDFALLDSLTHHWKTFTAETCRDAQLRITELLDFLTAPVGGQPAKESKDATPMEVDGKPAAAPVVSPKQKAVDDSILEEALRVHRTIQQRFPLFKVGHSIAKQVSLVSAIMLDVAHQTTAGQVIESEHSSAREPTQAISVKRASSQVQQPQQQQQQAQQPPSNAHMNPPPFPGVILPLLPSPQNQSRAMVQPPASMYSAPPTSGFSVPTMPPQLPPQPYPYMQQMPNYGQYAPNMAMYAAQQQQPHPQQQMHQAGAMGMMMPPNYSYGYQGPALPMPQTGMPPQHTNGSSTAPPSQHGLKRKQIEDPSFDLQKSGMNYGALAPYPSYSTTSSMTSFGFSHPQQPPPFYQPGYMPQPLAQAPQQQQQVGGLPSQLPPQPQLAMNPHAFHATAPVDFNAAKRPKV